MSFISASPHRRTVRRQCSKSNGRLLLTEQLESRLLLTGGGSIPMVSIDSIHDLGAGAYSISISATDPDGDSLAVFVDWGDGQIEEVTCDFASIVHFYEESGEYDLTVMVEDPSYNMSYDFALLEVLDSSSATFQTLHANFDATTSTWTITGQVAADGDLEGLAVEIAGDLLVDTAFTDSTGSFTYSFVGSDTDWIQVQFWDASGDASGWMSPS